MVGSHHGIPEHHWAGTHSSLASKEEVGLTPDLLLDDLPPQVPNDIAMFLLQQLSLGGLVGLSIPDSCRACCFILSYGACVGLFDFFDHLKADGLSF